MSFYMKYTINMKWQQGVRKVSSIDLYFKWVCEQDHFTGIV